MKKLLLCSMMVFLMPVIASAASEKFMEVIFGSKGKRQCGKNIQVYTKTATYTGKPDTDIAGKTWTVANFNNNNNSWADMIKCGNKTAALNGICGI